MNIKAKTAEAVRNFRWRDASRYLSRQEDDELKRIGKYIKGKEYIDYPYNFFDKYKTLTVVSGVEDGFPFVIDCGHKLYGKKSQAENEMVDYYKNLCAEQDALSPHCYITDKEREPEENDVIIDCGAAEGFFGLRYIEKCKKVILLECEESWIEALKKTFAPWPDKVEIAQRYVGGITDESCTTLDDFLKSNTGEQYYIKADIEGFERDLLRGAVKTLSHTNKILLCVYHRMGDEEFIKSHLESAGFDVTVNGHYILFWQKVSDFRRPYVRHGVIYGKNAKLTKME